MEFLKKRKNEIILSLLLLLSSCGEDTTITQIIKVKVDTYISSISNSNNSDKKELSLVKDVTKEERIIFKLPTNNEEEESFFDHCFDDINLCNIFFMPSAILVKILTSCSQVTLQPANLTSAILIFNTNDGSSIAAGELDLNLLAKPWWHSVIWTSSHPFSNEGKWINLGGDFDHSVSFNSNCNALTSGACGAGEIKFDVTEYFKGLISNTSIQHFGMTISPNTTLSTSKIYSSQAESVLSPRVEATYTGSCISSLHSPEQQIQTKVFYLGTPID